MEQTVQKSGPVVSALKFYFSVYWRTTLAIFVFQMLMLALFYMGLMGACRFDGTNMVECSFFGMDMNYLADAFVAVWMIPMIGVVFGLLTAPAAAVMTAFWICAAIFVYRALAPKKERADTTISRG